MSERKGRLDGRKTLVTGASRGIGRAIALQYAAEGADVFLVATNTEKLSSVKGEIDALGGNAEIAVCDVSDDDQVQKTFEKALGWRDGIDVVVNNAGIYVGRPITQYSYEEFDKIMKTNVYSVFRIMQLALTHMETRGAGKIVNIASTAGKWESPNQSAYNTSKHAVVGMTRCAALEYAAKGVNVNAICPGMVETDMFSAFDDNAKAAGLTLDELRGVVLQRVPMGRFLEPDEIAHLAVYLASSESDGMTGQTLTISGGMRMG